MITPGGVLALSCALVSVPKYFSVTRKGKRSMGLDAEPVGYPSARVPGSGAPMADGDAELAAAVALSLRPAPSHGPPQMVITLLSLVNPLIIRR